LKHGTGGLNIDGCRVEADETLTLIIRNTESSSDGWARPWMADKDKDQKRQEIAYEKANSLGRFPANVIHDGSDEVLELFPNDAARFFYCAKASASERDGSTHPTMKPIALMRYLCRLVTPPNGTVLEPFAGSGTTAMACIREGFKYIAIERESEYCAIASRRIESELDQMRIDL